MSRHSQPKVAGRSPDHRRGAALVVVLLFVVAAGALALSATYLTANSALMAKSYDREAELRYAAEVGLGIGKSQVNFDANALPDTGYNTLLSKAPVTAADGKQIPGVTVSVYAGPSGSTSGQFGRFSSVVADARDAQGNGFVRRLELTQESFAKFAYWSDQETNNGSTIYFGSGDQLWGPVWSNDNISINSGGATFHDEVGTAGTINGTQYGTFSKGYKTNQKLIQLPSLTTLSKLAGYAATAGLSLAPPSTGDETLVRMRLEFVAVDLNGDGDSTDTDEGFFRVYSVPATNIQWLRSDWTGTTNVANVKNCGDWHRVSASSSELRFFPVSIHSQTWFKSLLQATGEMTATQASNESSASVATIMTHANARCYLGGDPHLVAVERTGTVGQIGGSDSTFTAVGNLGSWQKFTDTPDLRLTNVAHRQDAKYLFPLHRSINPGSKGVIYASGTIGVSGVLRGRVTLYSNAYLVVLDDMRYANDPSKGVCLDILGLIAAKDIVVADNALNTPQSVNGGTERNLDDSKDLNVHSVLMALGTSWRVQNYNAGPSNANGCESTPNGRGCLYLTGGIIQEDRGEVGTAGGTGFIKLYSYDRCAIVTPPPYFPTTGRFNDNRYYELDPVNFSVASLFKSITPDP